MSLTCGMAACGGAATVWLPDLVSQPLLWEPFTVSHFWKWLLSFMGTKGCRTRQIAGRVVLGLLLRTGHLDAHLDWTLNHWSTVMKTVTSWEDILTAARTLLTTCFLTLESNLVPILCPSWGTQFSRNSLSSSNKFHFAYYSQGWFLMFSRKKKNPDSIAKNAPGYQLNSALWRSWVTLDTSGTYLPFLNEFLYLKWKFRKFSKEKKNFLTSSMQLLKIICSYLKIKKAHISTYLSVYLSMNKVEILFSFCLCYLVFFSIFSQFCVQQIFINVGVCQLNHRNFYDISAKDQYFICSVWRKIKVRNVFRPYCLLYLIYSGW